MTSGNGAIALKKVPQSRKLRLTRAEKAELIRRRLFDAAIKVVGTEGYAGATVSRITRLAGVAQGTFYNYFPNRQDLLDQLLPTVGQRLLKYIAGKLTPDLVGGERELMRFTAFFDFLLEMPEFLRILTEAQIYAPVAYDTHIEMVSRNYLKALRQERNESVEFSDAELEVIIHIMLGARNYLCQHYSYTDGRVHSPPREVITAYGKLISLGVFKPVLGAHAQDGRQAASV